MRITTPRPGERADLDEVDLADPMLYAHGDAHLVWQTLRAERPVFWQRRGTGPGFWVVTRRADVAAVLRDHETFTSERGTAIAMLGAPDPAAGKMMHATDPPRHRQMRERLHRSLAPNAVSAHAADVRSIVRCVIAGARDAGAGGGPWDAAAAFVRLPGLVAARLMGLPESEVDSLLRLSFASLAPLDPRYRFGSERVTLRRAHYEILRFFTELLRTGAVTGLVADVTGIEVDGRRLNREEILFNCLSLIVGAVVTTAQAASATMIALIGQGGGEGHWARDTPVRTAVEEALRWSSPTTHFMRRARRDVELHGVRIRAGDAVTAWIGSANRDETVFERPYVLDLARTPNRHLAFGSGPHSCVGAALARLMLRILFEELFAGIECFESAGPPEHLVSNEIAGVVSLPLRVRPRPR